MKKVTLSATLFLAVCVGLVSAQFSKPEPPVKLKFVPAENPAAGATAETKLEVEIAKGWHIFSEKPEIERIRGSQLLLDTSDDFTVEKISFAKPISVYSDVFQKTLNFYQDHLTIAVLLKLNQNENGSLPVKGTFLFQACSDRLCLPPGKLTFSGVQTIQ